MVRARRRWWQTAIEVHDERIRAITQQGQQLIADGNAASTEIQRKLDELQSSRAALGDKVDERRKQVRFAVH